MSGHEGVRPRGGAGVSWSGDADTSRRARGLPSRVGSGLLVALLVVLTACGPGETADGAPGGGAAQMASASSDYADALPDHAPARFGFGEEATGERIALWDIDVRPDGEGLPPGSGTVAEGREVYMTYCVACHGPTGTEGPNDVLVDTTSWELHPPSRAVGTFWPHATTLYDYIRKAMPQLTPGILDEDQVYAVIAYILHLNDIVPEDAVMSAETLPEVVMPAAGRFVEDDRRGGDGPVR